MAHEVKLHSAQTAILRELLFHPTAGFAQLQKPTNLTSDHFNFHISRLQDLSFVTKLTRGQYKLTPAGKEYANRLDTDNDTIERQPKLAVLLGIERQHNGQTQYLFQERLKNPWYGFWGIPGGKVRWGETILQAAARELKEETGLSGQHKLAGIYHEHTYLDNEPVVSEDKVFFVVSCTNLQGQLIKEFEGGRNQWFSVAETKKLTPKFKSFDLELEVILGQHSFIEHDQHYQQDDF